MSDQQVAEPQAKKEEKREDGLADILHKYPSAPSQEQIEQWKTEFGEVFVSGFSEEHLYIWRPISRPEWVQLQAMAADPEAQMTQYRFEEMVCDTCVLWRSINVPWAKGKAGTPTSLQEQILQNSDFLSPQAASLLVAKL